ncbi:MAG: integrase [Gammaproteobacteria bacterium]|nr:MAG: integrase [Gammaproteobacteria bacterium]
MPRKAVELSALAVSRIKKPGSHPVGGVAGLLLRVSNTGARSWVLRITTGTRVNAKGKTVQRRRDIGLGGYPDVTLAQAREKARLKREQVEQGIDPIKERKAARRALQDAQAKYLSFGQAAKQCHKIRAAEFRNEKHAKQWINTLTQHAFPILENIPVDEIETAHVHRVLEPIWSEKTETARRVRQRIEAVLRWAYTKKKISRENPARWNDNLKELLPAPTKIHRVQHHPSLPYPEIAEFLQDLRDRPGKAAKALEFAILTGARSGEVRGATWEEIDVDKKLWVVPGGRIKGGKLHTVPLCEQAMKTIGSTQGSGLLFPAPRGGEMSDMTLSKKIKDMHKARIAAGKKGYVDPKLGNRVAVPHGFRSTFKDWCRETTRFPDEVSELALSHVNNDATRAAYARSELLDQRRELMAVWANYCESIADNVVRIGTLK